MNAEVAARVEDHEKRIRAVEDALVAMLPTLQNIAGNLERMSKTLDRVDRGVRSTKNGLDEVNAFVAGVNDSRIRRGVVAEPVTGRRG